MLLNHRYRFVYLAAPRTASISVRTWLSDLPGSVLLADHHRMSIPAECGDYFAWSTFRDPRARAVSLHAYHWRNDPDRRPWSQYVADLPTMHPFHSRSQCQWIGRADQPVELIPLRDDLELRIRQAVFLNRGYADPPLPELPSLNGTTHGHWQTCCTAAQLIAILRHWFDDYRTWLDLN